MRFEYYMSEDETCTTFFEMSEDSYGARLRAENILASPFQELF